MKKNDVILIALLLFLAVILYIIISVFGVSSGAYVEVTKNGEITGRYSLAEDASYVIGDDEEYNILIIKDGRAYITEASCPNMSCVGQGSIDATGGSIICVPNRLIITVVSGTSQKDGAGQSGPDAVSY